MTVKTFIIQVHFDETQTRLLASDADLCEAFLPHVQTAANLHSYGRGLPVVNVVDMNEHFFLVPIHHQQPTVRG